MIGLDRSRGAEDSLERDEVVTPNRISVVHSSEGESLPVDRVFGLLKDERRRLVLAYLGQQDGPVSMDELVEYVATFESDEAVSQLDAADRKRIYVDLYQAHLPMMDGLGAVDLDRSRGKVEAGERFELFERYLSSEGKSKRAAVSRWNKCYPLLSGMGVVFFGAGLVVSDPLFTQTVFGVLVSAFAACSILGLRASSGTRARDE
jgi:hypothetical protein